MHFSFAYDYAGRPSYFREKMRNKYSRSAKHVIVKMKRPYFIGMQEVLGDNKWYYSLEELMKVGNHLSDAILKRLPNVRVGTFLLISDHLWRNGPKYGLVAVSDEEAQTYFGAVDGIAEADKKAKSLHEKMKVDVPEYAEYLREIERLDSLKKKIKEMTDE